MKETGFEFSSYYSYMSSYFHVKRLFKTILYLHISNAEKDFNKYSVKVKINLFWKMTNELSDGS